MKREPTSSEVSAYTALSLSELTLTILIAKKIISLDEVREVLLSISFALDEKSQETTSGKTRQSLAFKGVKDMLMDVLERLEQPRRSSKPE